MRRAWRWVVMLFPLALPAQRASRPVLPFLGGAASAFVAHELSHVAADLAFGARVSLKRVEFHGVPFFAVTHSATVTRRQEYVISSAGFWSQHASSEWLLTRRPQLRAERAPFAKGVLAFNVLTSTGYALAAFAETGPAERDTRSLAIGARVREPVAGAMILAPAMLDTWRYYHPHDRVTPWLSRGVKLGLVALTVR